MKIAAKKPEAVVKRAFWLAWQACGSPLGMGWLQNRPSATEEDVWKNINHGKLGGDLNIPDRFIVIGGNEPGKLHAVYVFGRMMKLSLEWDADGVIVLDTEPRPDYQSWCVHYPTYQCLVEAAMQEVEV